MSIIKWKVHLYNWLPAPAFRLLLRIYRIGVTGLTSIPVFRSSRWAFAARVARRPISAADRRLLSARGDSKLQQWNEAFEVYEGPHSAPPINLAWVHKPIGGNFGDWLSPYIVAKVANREVHHTDLTDARRSRHVLSLGSIISRANRNSIVVGSGVNSLKDAIDQRATFRMVRGYITRELLPRHARSADLPCCDPGFFVEKLYTPRKAEASKLLIPHINHHQLFASIDQDEFELLSAQVCRKDDLERLIDQIASAEEVITSAMHVFVISCSYGVRCALIKPLDADIKVPGDGIKYRDCMSTVMTRDFYPVAVRVRKQMRLRDEVETRVESIDRLHIEASFSYFKDVLSEI